MSFVAFFTFYSRKCSILLFSSFSTFKQPSDLLKSLSWEDNETIEEAEEFQENETGSEDPDPYGTTNISCFYLFQIIL